MNQRAPFKFDQSHQLTRLTAGLAESLIYSNTGTGEAEPPGS
jgi:hypothetical protein